MENGVADMSSPRSAEVSTVIFLRLIDDSLRDRSATDPAMMAAQDRLVEVQSRAAELVSSQSDVKSVRWVLDRRWFERRGVFPQ